MKTNATTNEENRAKDQAAAQYSSICEMVANLDRETAIAHFVEQLNTKEVRAHLSKYRTDNEIEAPWCEYFRLPSCWASYLINCDASGLTDEEKAQADAFCEENAKGMACVDVTDEGFCTRNDAGTLAGDCGKYAFLPENPVYPTDEEDKAALIEAMKDNDFEPAGFSFDEDEARQTIQEDALSVEVRSGWQSAGETLTPSEFAILLCTGGPAVRIRGELNEYNEPDRAWLEYQDWGTPWTQYFGNDVNDIQDTLLAYAREFYFTA